MNRLIVANQPAQTVPTGARLIAANIKPQLTENIVLLSTFAEAGTYFLTSTLEVFGTPPASGQLPALQTQFQQTQNDGFGSVTALGAGTTTLPPLTNGQVATASVQFTHIGGNIIVSFIKGHFPSNSVNQLSPALGQWFYSASCSLFVLA
jgi:hypothetical protein